jgi:predicted permease
MLRSLIKNWQLNSIAVLSLAVAMALTIVALSVSNAILFRPPVARDPSTLVTVYAADRAHSAEPTSFTYPEYQYFRDHNRSFLGIAAMVYGYSKQIITFGRHDEMVMVNAVSDNYFQVLGIQPYLGRTFSPGDDRRQDLTVLLTYACWQRWGADPKILGKAVKEAGRTMTIIGVTPKQFIAPVFGIAADLIESFATHPEHGEGSLEDPAMTRYTLIGRLSPTATRPQARAEVQSLWAQFASAHPKDAGQRTPVLTGLNILGPDSIDTARLLSVLMIAAAMLILLIACANTTNLLLALATLRRQEALIKTALGAPRGRLILEFLRETLVLCGTGALVGYLIAAVALRFLSRFDITVPPYGMFPISIDLHPGIAVAAGTLILIVGASTLSGLAPALYASKPNLASALTGEIAIGGSRRGWIRNTVVAVQVGVCTLALAGTGLCLQSLANLRNVDPGFSARKIAAALMFPGSDAVEAASQTRLYDTIRDRVRALPGVLSVTLATDLPLGGDSPDSEDVRFPDRPPRSEPISIFHSVVDGAYFETLGIQLLEGRTFRPDRGGKGPEEVVVNRFFADKYWPHQQALGRSIMLGKDHRPAVVVGIAANGRYADLDEKQQAYLYESLDRNFQAAIMLVARTAGDPKQIFEPMTRIGRELGNKLPLPPMTLDDVFNLTLFSQRVTLGCVSGLSVLAVLLATVGLYGAISYAVRERRRELGIRIALGARPGQVMTLVFRRTMAIAGTGVLIGLGLGVAAGLIFRSQFYRIHTLEFRVLAPVGIGMAAMSLTIAWAAARRWTRMNPLDAVRHI